MKRNYLAESGLGFQYGDTPLKAITGLLDIQRREFKGRSVTVNVYDTTDVPLGARIYTDTGTSQKSWTLTGRTNGPETGTLLPMFSLLDEDTADYWFTGEPEHVIVNEAYFNRVQQKLKP